MLCVNQESKNMEWAKAIGHPVKVTALHYITEMVWAEQYEELPDVLAIALEFGATEQEISNVITRHITLNV
jgi:hypothetical protein